MNSHHGNQNANAAAAIKLANLSGLSFATTGNKQSVSSLSTTSKDDNSVTSTNNFNVTDDEDAGTSRRSVSRERDQQDQSSTKKSFPEKLYDLLNDPEYVDIIHWIPDRRNQFVIADKERFTLEVLPCIFREAKFASFVRRLLRWNFKRASKSPHIHIYTHDLFRKSDRRLCRLMRYGSVGKKSEVSSWITSDSRGESGNETLSENETTARAVIGQMQENSDGSSTGIINSLQSDLERCQNIVQAYLAGSVEVSLELQRLEQLRVLKNEIQLRRARALLMNGCQDQPCILQQLMELQPTMACELLVLLMQHQGMTAANNNAFF